MTNRLLPYGALFSLCLVAGCGNGWFTSASREKTPSAQFLKAQAYYDKGKFTEAAAVYEQLLAADPNNDRARVRLAYSLNGMAGLSPLDLLTKLSGLQSKSTPKPSSAGAAPAAATAKPATGLNSLTNIAGLSKAQTAAVAKANPEVYTDLTEAATKYKSFASSDAASYALIVSASDRVNKLRRSWSTICQLVPSKVLTSVVGTNAVRRKGLDIDKCRGGYPQDTQDPAVLFAAAMESLAQGSMLFQIKLDTDGDGVVDVVKKAETLTKEITALNSSSQTATNPTEISENLSKLNTKVTELNAIGATLKGELVDLSLAHFEVMSLLFTVIKDVVPANVAKTLTTGITKFEEARSKIGGYSKASAGGKTTANAKQDKIQSSAKSAVAAADKSYENFVANETDHAKKAAFETEFAKTCDNFDALATNFGLGTTVSKPTNCAKVSNLTSAESAVNEPMMSAVDNVDGTADTAFSLESGAETNLEESADASAANDGTSTSGAGDLERGVVDFAQYGEGLVTAP